MPHKCQQTTGKSPLLAALLHRITCKRHLPLPQPSRLVDGQPITIPVSPLTDRNFWQADILHDRPHNAQARSLRRKGVNLIGALAHIAKQALNRIGAPNVTMQNRRKRIKGQQMLFILT